MGAHSLCSGLLQERWSDQGALRSSSWCCNPSTCLSCHRAIAVLAAIVLCFGGCIRGTAALATHNTTYRIGGLAITGADAFLASFGPTFSDYLNETVGEAYSVGFVAVPLAFDEVWDAVSNAAVDFLFLNPSSASCMESEFGVSSVLSLRNLRQGYELNEFGGVLITAANRTDITEIAHVEDKIVEGVSITGLGAFQLQWGLLEDRGVNLMVDPSEVRLAYNQKKIVYDVIAGNADVGFVRTDMVERMDAAGEINITDVKFVEPRGDLAEAGFPFPSSTDLVPEWPLQAMPHVPADLVKAVMVALMELNITHPAATSGAYSTWDPPLSYSSLSFFQVQLGILDYDARHCLESENVYGAIVCPTGFFKLSEEIVDSQCSDLARTCPDEYTCLCRPCELLPDVTYSVFLGEPEGNRGVCEKMRTCLEDVFVLSALTLTVVDEWGLARESLRLNNTEILEVHVVAAGQALACYTPDQEFPCDESVINGGLGAPSLNATDSASVWEHSFPLSVNTSGSILLRVFADGVELDSSPTLLSAKERSCGSGTYNTEFSGCFANASFSAEFSYKDEWKEICDGYVDLPPAAYDMECDYAPPVSVAGVVSLTYGVAVTGVALLLTLWTVRYRKEGPIKASQWVFCAIFSASLGLVVLGQLLAVGRPTDFSCVAQPVLVNIGWSAAISSLCVKVWRVMSIWKAGFKRMRIKNATLMRYLAALVSVDVALLTAMCVVDRPRVTNIVEAEFISGALVDVNRSRCDMGQLGLIHLGLGVYHAIVATAGCVASFRTRSVSSQYMERQSIAVAIALILGTLGLVAFTTSSDTSPATKVLLTSVGTNTSALIALACIYGPKVAWVHFVSPTQAHYPFDYSENPTCSGTMASNKLGAPGTLNMRDVLRSSSHGGPRSNDPNQRKAKVIVAVDDSSAEGDAKAAEMLASS